MPRKAIVIVGAVLMLTLGAASSALGSPASGVRLADPAPPGAWTDERVARAVPRGPAPLAASGSRTTAGEAERRQRRRAVMRPVSDPSAWPHLGTGKLVMRFGRHQIAECSAAILDTPRGNVAWTAAHCLRDPGPFGQWARQVAFIPSFDRGARPFGTWSGRSIHVARGWVRWNQKVDVGAVVLQRKQGTPVKDVVGQGYPLRIDPAVRQRWTAPGYPAQPRFERRMWECISPALLRDRMQRRLNGPQPIGIACGMGAGSSGGPWLTGGGAIGAVTSYRIPIPRLRNRLFATVMGGQARRLAREVGWSP